MTSSWKRRCTGPHRSPSQIADEVGDLLERAAELLGAGDERQPASECVVVESIAGVGAGRRFDQADALVVAQRRGAEPAAIGHLADRVGAHPAQRKASTRVEGQDRAPHSVRAYTERRTRRSAARDQGCDGETGPPTVCDDGAATEHCACAFGRETHIGAGRWLARPSQGRDAQTQPEARSCVTVRSGLLRVLAQIGQRRTR